MLSAIVFIIVYSVVKYLLHEEEIHAFIAGFISAILVLEALIIDTREEVRILRKICKRWLNECR